MAAKDDSGSAAPKPGDVQPVAGQPAGDQPRQEVRLRIDERNLHTSYANAFRSDATAEEVMIYFGLNLVNPVPSQQGTPEFIFQVSERIIMNYAMAKRLALTLGRMIRRHEEQFGEIELDLAKRRKDAK